MRVDELKQLVKTSKNSRMRNRYLAIVHFTEGQSRADIARYLKVARGSVNSWVQKYLDHGINGLSEGNHTGRPNKLTAQQLDTISHFIYENSVSTTGGRLQAKDVQSFILSNFRIQYQISNIYRLLHQLNHSWITSRSRHPKQDEGAQKFFKKLSGGNDP